MYPAKCTAAKDTVKRMPTYKWTKKEKQAEYILNNLSKENSVFSNHMFEMHKNQLQ